MEVTTKSESVERGLKFYFTGEPCSKGHISARYVSSGKCCQCNSERCAKRRNEKSEQVKAEKRAYHAANKETISAKRRAEYLLSPDRAKERARKRYEENRDGVLQSNREWRKRNWEKCLDARRHRHASEQSARKAAKIKRTPTWLSEGEKAAIKTKYAEARWMSEISGVLHQVDHFYPLQGEFVSGLHVPSNLRVIPARENTKKSHRMPKFERLPL